MLFHKLLVKSSILLALDLQQTQLPTKCRFIHQYAPLCSTESSTKTIGHRRVVVTGLGVISPIGCTTPIAWQNILNGECGIKQLTDKAYETLPCKIAAKIDKNELKLDDNFTKSELRSHAPATIYALLAGK